MRKITSFGMTAAALGALGWVATAQAQPAPEGTPAPATAPAAPAPAPAPEAAPAPAPAPDNSAPAASPAPDASAPADNSGTAPAPAKSMKHHKMMHGSKGKIMSMHRGGDAGNAAVEDLNAKSLSAAKSGSNYTPSKADESTPAPKDEGKGMKPMHHMHHHHMMMKKKAAASDSSTPAPDATPAPAGTDSSGSDSSGK